MQPNESTSLQHFQHSAKIGVEYVFWTKTTSELTVKKQIIRKKITMLFNVIRCAYVENFFQNITNDIINKY